HDVFHSSLLRIHIPNDDRLFPGRSYEQVVGLDDNEWRVDRVLSHKGFKSDAMFLILWKSGDKTWLPYSKVQHLQPLKEYFETLGITDIAHLPPIVGGEDPMEGTEGLFAGSVDFLDYKNTSSQDLDFPLSLNLIAFPAMTTLSTIAFFAPRDYPEIVLKWTDRIFEISQKDDAATAPVRVTVDEMILTLHASAAIRRGWNITLPPRYVEITRAINRLIPFETAAWFSFIDEGKTYTSKAVLTYDYFFNPVQYALLRETGQITKKFNHDVNKAFPKPPRPSSGNNNRGSSHRSGHGSGVSPNVFTRLSKSQADRDILFLGLMSYARQAESRNRGKNRLLKSVRGAEAYQKSIDGDGSTVAGLNDRINAWRITTPGKDNNAMDSSGPSAAGPSAGPSTV
ncbi:hypothetical protein F5878DRAFT_130703, partial [Lentinula raphanica]